MVALGNQYIHPLTFKRPVGAMRHPQITITTCLIHYVSIHLLGLRHINRTMHEPELPSDWPSMAQVARLQCSAAGWTLGCV